ncbi:unnamed protein product [Rotaria sordida]|nr:unnamed protein product [Rotaria sordida]
MTNEEDTDDEMDDYDETDHSDLKNRFTLEEMENIIEWVDEHPNARFATISNRFRKIKFMNYITKFREYIENDGTTLEKLKQIKAFIFDEFYLKRTIEKEALHDTDLELQVNRLSILLKEKTEYHPEDITKLLPEPNQTKNFAV